MTDEKLPRDVPLDPMVPGKYYNDYVRTIVAAEVLGVEDATIRRYARDKRLPAIKEGKTWYISRDALAVFKKPKTGNPAWTKKSNES